MLARNLAFPLSFTLVFGLCSCPSGLDRPSGSNVDLPPNKNIGQGFEPGLATTSPLGNDSMICGAIIPGATGQPDLSLAFFLFTTATDAANADGNGAPLVKETPPPVDGNAASDVFVAAVVRSSNPGSTTPNTFTQTIAPVMRHPRCVNCHSFHYGNGSIGTGGQHTGGDSNGTNIGCSGCHDADIGLSETGTVIVWRSPLPAQGDFDFRGKTTQQLYQMVMTNSVPDVVSHLKGDDRIFWAIERGIDPNLSNLGDVPISKAQWDVMVDAWAVGGIPPQFGGTGTGFLFDTSGAVKDLTLVSRKADLSFNQAGNAASQAPHAVYVPDAGYDPNSTAPQIAGRVHVVFSSDATDLLENVGNPSVARDVWHAVIEVRMNEEPQAGLPDPGKINLLARQNLLERMSRSPAGVRGNFASNHPKISNDASRVVFDSLATNLIAGFVDLNGGAFGDVFVAEPGTNNTTLASHANGFVARGGNGESLNPNISSLAEAVVFETKADNLIPPGPLNGQQNIALSLLPAATTSLVSVDSNGNLGTGGDCRNPSVFITAGGAALVVFESDMTDLVSSPVAITSTQIYMRVSGVTQLVTRKGNSSGNGASTLPSISADGKTILFQSLASNLDSVRPIDLNGASDVLRFDVDARLTSNLTVIERVSIAPDGSGGDAASDQPRIANFAGPGLSFSGGALGLYRTLATNTGKAVNSDAMLVFLANPGP